MRLVTMTMNSNLLRFIPWLILFLVACNLAKPQPPTPTADPPSPVTTVPILGDLGFGTVSGKITEVSTGAPIAGAMVTCDHFSYVPKETDNCNRSTTTDSDGDFLFENVFFHDTDTITLTVQATGYTPVASKHSSFTLAFLEANIQLSLIGSETTTTLDGPFIANCPMFPANNFWNARVDSLPTHPLSDAWIQSIGRSESFHMDFGSGEWEGGLIGIPYNIVTGSAVPKYEAEFYYPDESDAGPYPIPDNPNIEAGGDRHILTVDTETCTLYEIYDASFENGKWSGGSGAIWDLNANVLRPETWTSADAAGLPILPGLVRYDEIAAGEIKHALRFTIEDTAGYIWPARHQTSDPQDGIPPMGARFRLKADYDILGFPTEMQILLHAMKEYGIVLADNGSNWYVSGAPDERWDNDMLHLLDVLTGNDFEAVDTLVLMVDINSGQAK
jgi:hypothetical protein